MYVLQAILARNYTEFYISPNLFQTQTSTPFLTKQNQSVYRTFLYLQFNNFTLATVVRIDCFQISTVA